MIVTAEPQRAATHWSAMEISP